MTCPRIVVCSLGVVAPCGTTIDSFWNGLLSAKPRVVELSSAVNDVRFIGCPVSDDGWTSIFSHAEVRRLDRIALLGIAAADQAVADVGIHDVDSHRIGMAIGVGFGGIATLISQHQVLLAHGWRRLSPFGVPATMPSSLAAFASIRFGVRGPVTTVTSACASGTHAFVEAARMLCDGSADLVIAGGAEAPLVDLSLASFLRMDAMAQAIDPIETTCRPFDRDRRGFVLGEGAGFAVLATETAAALHRLPVIATLDGWALSTDARHITAPDDALTSAERCLRDTLGRAGLSPEDIGHVNAHGTATRLNDLAEGQMLARVFGHAGVPVTSTKGTIGHLMGAAGAVEAVATIRAMNERVVPPTANCDQIDNEIPLDVVRGSPRTIKRAAALSCSFGFGGQNAAVAFAPC